MNEPAYIDKLENLKSESDLKSLQASLDAYSAYGKVSGNPEFVEIKNKLNGYQDNLKNNIPVSEEDIASLQKKWKDSRINRASRSFWLPRAWALIVATIIFLPLLYYKKIITPGYELLIVIPALIILIYLVLKKR